MPYVTGTTYTLTVKDKTTRQYTFSPKHRGKVINDEISKWLVDHGSEAKCFINSADENFVADDRAWGFLKVNNGFVTLGHVSIDLETHDLKFAKFTEDRGSIWHGYPCHFKRKGDKPPKSILTKWVKDKTITKKEMSKISAYQKCNL